MMKVLFASPGVLVAFTMVRASMKAFFKNNKAE
jgi:hypothetical protein